ncbi:MAG: carboxylesterase family protein, partial [Acidobacteria bacterium]|nr:carboxylesterase family protein [Acidobacteriota bacterium]
MGGMRYAVAQEKAEVVVKTPSGSLRGLQAEGVRVFRGVPFAQPPVGDLR